MISASRFETLKLSILGAASTDAPDRSGMSSMAVIWVFVLVALLPPLRTALPLTDSGRLEVMALPPLLLVLIPLCQILLPGKAGIGSKAKGQAEGGGLSQGLTADMNVDERPNPLTDDAAAPAAEEDGAAL